MQNEIHNKTDSNTDTTVQIQLFREMVPQMANIAQKRDMKLALKLAQKTQKQLPSIVDDITNHETTSDDLTQPLKKSNENKKLTKKEQYYLEDIFQDGKLYKYAEDPEGYIAARKRQQNRNSAKRSRCKQNELIATTSKQLGVLLKQNQKQISEINQLSQQRQLETQILVSQQKEIQEMRNKKKTEQEIMYMFANQSQAKEQKIIQLQRENAYLRNQLQAFLMAQQQQQEITQVAPTTAASTPEKKKHFIAHPIPVKLAPVSTPTIVQVDPSWFSQQTNGQNEQAAH